MEGKSYLEILAENDEEARHEYEPNAKDLLVRNIHQYEDDVEAEDNHPDELEDQEAFNKPQGSYHASAEDVKPAPHIDNTKQSTTYNTTDIFRHVVNIDSKFRDNLSDIATSFTYVLKKPLKNIINIRLSSVEIPNTSYVFNCDLYQNVAFDIYCDKATPTYGRIKLEDGNYEEPFIFVGILNDRFEEIFGAGEFTCVLSPVSAKVTITNVKKNAFRLDFTTIQSNRPYQNGIGFNIGFRHIKYPVPDPITKQAIALTEYTGEAIVNTIECNYMFLSIGNDYDVIEHRSFNTNIKAYAKIIVDVPKNAVIYNNGSNTITNEYFFRQPSNVSSLQIKLFDQYEQLIDLNGMDFSFTLELDEVINRSLYNSILKID